MFAQHERYRASTSQGDFNEEQDDLSEVKTALEDFLRPPPPIIPDIKRLINSMVNSSKSTPIPPRLKNNLFQIQLNIPRAQLKDVTHWREMGLKLQSLLDLHQQNPLQLNLKDWQVWLSVNENLWTVERTK